MTKIKPAIDMVHAAHDSRSGGGRELPRGRNPNEKQQGKYGIVVLYLYHSITLYYNYTTNLIASFLHPMNKVFGIPYSQRAGRYRDLICYRAGGHLPHVGALSKGRKGRARRCRHFPSEK